MRTRLRLGYGGRFFGALVPLCLHAGQVNLVVETFFHNCEQLIELAVAGQALDDLLLPVAESVRDELVVFLSRQCLHEEEIARGHTVLNTRRANHNRVVRVRTLNEERALNLFWHLVIEKEQIRRRRLRSPEALVELV